MTGMVIKISHRGNTSGPNKERENSPSYISEALQKYDVEIDVWFIDGEFFLGHDKPTYPIHISFLRNPKLWCHAKNLQALTRMLKNSSIHCFWHQSDDLALTSQNYLWTYPGKELAKTNAIAVLPEIAKGWDIDRAVGICSDFIERY